MERQNSLFDAAVSHKLPEAKQRKSKEKKRSYSIGRPEVSKSKSEVNEPEIPKVISDSEYSIRIKSLSGYVREEFKTDTTETSFWSAIEWCHQQWFSHQGTETDSEQW